MKKSNVYQKLRPSKDIGREKAIFLLVSLLDLCSMGAADMN